MLPLLLYIMLLIAAPAGVAVVIQHVFREHEDAAFLREALYIAVTLYSCISMWATGAYGVRALEEDAMQHKRVVERGYECQIRMLRTRLGDTQQDLAMARVAIHEYEMQKRSPLAIFSKHSTPDTTPEVSPWQIPQRMYVVAIPPPSMIGHEVANEPLSSAPSPKTLMSKSESSYEAHRTPMSKSRSCSTTHAKTHQDTRKTLQRDPRRMGGCLGTQSL